MTRLTCELLLLLKHLGVKMVHGMRIGTCARGHTAAHHGSRIHLATGSGYTHVSGCHLLWHAGLGAGLAGIMSHTGCHMMAWRDSRVLRRHTTVMKTTLHGLHHVSGLTSLVDDPPGWIIDAPALLALSYVFKGNPRCGC